MSTTPVEALPQSELPLDAPVTAPVSSPDGKPDGAADEADPSPAAKTDTSDSPEPAVKGVQKRIDELTKNWRETERREREAARDAAYWREQALRSQTQAQSPPTPEPERAKVLADFNFDEAAFERHKLEIVAAAAEARAEKRFQEKEAQAKRTQLDTEYAKKARDFAKEHPDYHDIVPYAPISDPVADIIKGIERGPAVAYYLGQNPDIAMQLGRLPDSYAAFEIGQIAAKLKFEQDKVQSARTLVSKAPPPAPAIEAVNQVVQKDPKDMTQAEFNKWRRKQIAARKGWDSVE